MKIGAFFPTQMGDLDTAYEKTGYVYLSREGFPSYLIPH